MKKKSTTKLPWITLWDVVECKGRIGAWGSWHERLAFWMARKVASALMRDRQIAKEFTMIIGRETIQHWEDLNRFVLEPDHEKKTKRKNTKRRQP